MKLIDGGLVYKNYYIIADTHFGYEYELLKKNIYIKDLSEKILKKLFEICFREKIYRLIFLGDFKHEIFTNRKKLRDIISKIKEYFEVFIVKGNHDGKIEEIYEEKVFKKICFGKILLTHGHIDIDISKYKLIIIGHEHPYIRIGNEKIQTYIICKNKDGKKILILPAFNTVISGVNIIKIKKNEVLSPIFRKNFDIEESILVSKNGYYLDKLKNIKMFSKNTIS